MIKQEFSKIFKSVKSRVIFIIMNSIAFISAADVLINYFRYSKDIGTKSNATNAALLSSGTTVIPYYEVFQWILPIYFILAYCDKYVAERKQGMHYIYLTKAGRKKMFFSKISTSFFMSYIYCGIPLLLNLGILSVFLHDGHFFSGAELWNIETAGEFLYNCMHHPYLAYFGYLFCALFVFGLLSVMCQSLCILFNDNKMAYIISFSVWLGLYYTFDFLGINEAIQPFVYGYTPQGAIFAILKFLPAVLIPLILAYVRIMVKKDEV